MTISESWSDSPPATAAAPVDPEFVNDYRAISKAAVCGLLLALAGISALLTPMFLALPVFGLLFGLIGLRQISRYPDELSGRRPAQFAVVLSTALIAGSVGWHSYVYATEVPDDAQRVGFWEIMADSRPGQPPIPSNALQLDGQRIFIKGYVHPGVADSGMVDKFLLVPDMGTCCFGGTPKLTHQIDVRLSNNLKLKYSYRKRAVAGVFRVNPNVTDPSGNQGACYYLEADFLN